MILIAKEYGVQVTVADGVPRVDFGAESAMLAWGSLADAPEEIREYVRATTPERLCTGQVALVGPRYIGHINTPAAVLALNNGWRVVMGR